jgi:hypothetical protein
MTDIRKEVSIMTNKITYVSALSTAIENPSALTAEEIEKLIALRESIAKRNATKSTKPTKTQVANANYAQDILRTMTKGEAYGIADIRREVESLCDASSQKIAPIMNKLVDEGKLSKEIVKGKAVYRAL